MAKTLNNIMSLRTGITLLMGLALGFTALSCSMDKHDFQGIDYKEVVDVYGTIKVSGSTTMSNVLSLWCSGFSDLYHETNCIVESFGSSNAPKDLIQGKVDLGAMSDPMSAQDKANFKAKYGYEPLEIKVAIDVIAVLVSNENPLTCITASELDGIYSDSYLCQGSKDITSWGGLNLTREWMSTPIKVYGRTPSSGTYDVFKNMALCGGNFKSSITALASSRDIVEFVSLDYTSIGYSGAGLVTPRVKALGVGETKDKCFPPTAQYAVSGEYPFTRNLYLYTKENPATGMEKTTKEFLKYILSEEGQEAVLESGLVNLPLSVIKDEYKKLSN